MSIGLDPRLHRVAILGAALLASAASLSHAQVVTQVTDVKTGAVQYVFGLDDAGAWVFGATRSNPNGDNVEFVETIYKWNAVSGVPQPIASLGGNTDGVTVSDDGGWLAFSSDANLLGRNSDHSYEIFAVRGDGTGLKQLTDDREPNGGSSRLPGISGNGQTIVFLSNSSFLGMNPDHIPTLWSIRPDGSNLQRLIGSSEPISLTLPVSLSDDGTKAVFSSPSNLTGSNSLRIEQIFAINTNGTGLRQLTNGTLESFYPALSGNGQSLAFTTYATLQAGKNPDHGADVCLLGYDGTGLRYLTDRADAQSVAGSITDDAQTIFLNSNLVNGASNSDRNYELWKIDRLGNNLTAVTNSTSPADWGLPVVSGGGGRIAVSSSGDNLAGGNADFSSELFVLGSNGSGLRQLTSSFVANAIQPALVADGSEVVFVSDDDPFGTNPFRIRQLFRSTKSGSNLRQLSQFVDNGGVYRGPEASGSGNVLSFSVTDSTGTLQLCSINGDGSNFRQLTQFNQPVFEHGMSRDGSLIAFTSPWNGDGAEVSVDSSDIFVIHPDGTGLQRLTLAPVNPPLLSSGNPRLDSTGSWIAFESYANFTGQNGDYSSEIYRMRPDGTGKQQISTMGAFQRSWKPDISGDGNLIVYSSNGNPFGTNPDHNGELFLWTASTGLTQQLTVTTDGTNEDARISEDGGWIYFISTAPIVEFDPDHPRDGYRIEVATGQTERVVALRLSNPTVAGALDPSDDGRLAVFSSNGNPTTENEDLGFDIFLVDRKVDPTIAVNPRSRIIVGWPAESGPLRYDVLRGQVDELSYRTDGTVSLGNVECLDDNSMDVVTVQHGDQTDPEPFPGRAYFFLVRSSLGLNLGPGSWGTSNTGEERSPTTGDCGP